MPIIFDLDEDTSLSYAGVRFAAPQPAPTPEQLNEAYTKYIPLRDVCRKLLAAYAEDSVAFYKAIGEIRNLVGGTDDLSGEAPIDEQR